VVRENRFSRNGTTVAVETGSSGIRFQSNRVELESPRPENLAAKGVASASCSPETAARALDGVCRGDDHAWAPGHVRVGDWFQVDLKQVCAVDSVVLFPRDGKHPRFLPRLPDTRFADGRVPWRGDPALQGDRPARTSWSFRMRSRREITAISGS